MIKIVVFLELFLICCASYAEEFGSWFTGNSDDSTYFAGTINESGSMLAQFCYVSESGCYWMLGMSTSCVEGDKYPVLANSNVGTATLMLYCRSKIRNGLYSYVFTNFDDVNEIVVKAVRVGFAVPLQSDEFKVIRFDLNGSSRSIDYMRLEAEKTQEKEVKKASSTKDLRI